MKSDRTRRFGVSDLMILVAAIGLGLWVTQLGWPRGQHPAPVSTIWVNGTSITTIASSNATTPGSLTVRTMPMRPSGGGYPVQSVAVPVGRWAGPIVPCLASLTAGLVVLALRSSRERRRAMFTRPGFVATVAATVVIAFEASLTLLVLLADGRLATPPSIGNPAIVGNVVVVLASRAGVAVGLAWTILALSGRWRPAKTWLDRSGRAIGIAWLVVGAGAGVIAVSLLSWGTLLL